MNRRKIAAVLTGLVCLTTVGLAWPASASEAPEPPATSLDALVGLESSVVTLDPATGEVLEIKDRRDVRIPTPVGPGCSASSMCLRGSPSIGYSGLGSRNVSHGAISSFYTGDAKGRIKWKNGATTVTSPQLGRDSVGLIGASLPVTWVQRER